MKKSVQDQRQKAEQDIEEISRIESGKRISLIGLLLNLFLFLIKLVAGILSSSHSVVADAINNLMDFSSSIISLVGFKLAGKSADKEHPYGHGRYEYLSGLLISILIFVVGVEIFRNGVVKIFNPQDFKLSPILIAVMVIGIIVKAWMMNFYQKGAKKINSQTLVAAAQDSFNDALVSFGVLFALVISFYTKINLDGYITVILAIYILWSGLELVRDMINPIIGISSSDAEIDEYTDLVLSLEGVKGVHDWEVHEYGPEHLFASVHIEVDKNLSIEEAHVISEDVKEKFSKVYNMNLTVHIDPYNG